MNSIDLSFNTQPKNYSISIESGLLNSSQAILKHTSGNSIFIISDSNVAPLYLEQLQRTLSVEAISVAHHSIPAGESSKSLKSYETIIETMIDKGIKRNDLVIALGGGVVGDLAGYIAATYFRGMNFLQIPTTLLSQVDSSIGGKTAINLPQGKNLVGAFHQPVAVIIDVDTLDTLPEREFCAGLAEIIKAAILDDAEFFSWLAEHTDSILQKDKTVLGEMIERSCRIKAKIVAQDEKEQGVRATLNLGHTFGHAIEKLAGYGALLHGEAVAIGMQWASQFAYQQGLLPREDALAIHDLIVRCRLPVCLPHNIIDDLQLEQSTIAEKLLQNMHGDKKNTSNDITLILPTKIGSVFITSDYAPNSILAFLHETI